MKSPFLTKPELKKITGTENPVDQMKILGDLGIEPVCGAESFRREDIMAYMAGKGGNAVFAEYDRLEKREPSKRRSAAEIAVSELYTKHKRRATKTGIKWGLTKKDIAHLLARAEGKCEVTGLAFNNEVVKAFSRRPYAPSIDRIDSSKGYAPANCRLVCVVTNLAMNEWGDKVITAMAKAMKENGKI